MKKKILLISLTLLLTVGLLAISCPAPAPAPAPTPAPAPAPQEVFTLKVQGFVPAGLAFHDILLRHAEVIEEFTDGRLKLVVFASGAVCPSMESLDAVTTGVLDATYVYTAMWIGKHRAAPLFCSTPGVFDAIDRGMWEYEGGGKELREEFYTKILGLDVHPIGAGLFGPEIFMWSTTPLRTIDDFKGKKIRMMPLMGEVLEAHGISSVYLPLEEIIPGLATGVLDAAEYSCAFFDIGAGFPDVAKYYHYPGIHQPSSMQEFVINGDWWRALPDDLKSKLDFICQKQAFWVLQYGGNLDVKALEKFEEMGNERVLLEPETVKTMLTWAWEFLDEEAKKDAFFAKVWGSQKAWMEYWYPYADAIHFSHALE